MPNSINLKTNRKEIEIQRDGEVVGYIYFDPTDAAIIDRLLTAKETLDKTPVPEITDDEDITVTMKKLREADGALRAAVDYAFAYPCSDVVFGDGFAITSRKGVSMFEQFLDGAMDIIEQFMDEEVKASAERQAKYLDKYRK